MQMSSALKGVHVLIVDDDEDALEMLFLALGAVGAIVRSAPSGEEALTLLEDFKPQVILSDLELPGIDGFEFLELVRANPRLRTVPAAALSGRLSKRVTGEKAARFEKYLAKPSRVPEIVAALAELVVAGRTAEVPAEPDTKLRAAIARLNGVSHCRYTSLLRFGEDQTLSSIWTLDRDHPKHDAFPVGLPVHASYCVLVRDSGKMAVIEDARTDPRVADHPKRLELARYIGVPLFHKDGSMFGTLCCYDEAPHEVDQATRDAVAAAARELEPQLEALR